MPIRIIATAVVVLMVVWGAFSLGQSHGAGECAQGKLEDQDAAISFSRAANEIEAGRSVSFAAQRDAVQTRAQGVKHAHPVPADDRSHFTESERVRLDALYNTYWPDAAAGGLPDDVPAAPAPDS